MRKHPYLSWICETYSSLASASQSCHHMGRHSDAASVDAKSADNIKYLTFANIDSP